ncbi:hypothetical protein GCM10009558_042470 [Virgisporangium aurantiacum]
MSEVDESPEVGEVRRQPVNLADLGPAQQDLVRLRQAHLLEVETGFRAGTVLAAEPGEPRPGYDPASTTLGQRRRAKVAELRALGAQARLLGLGQVSERTLERMAAAWRRDGTAGLIDRRLVRLSGGHPSVDQRVAEAIRAVHAETVHRSRISMTTRERLIRQYVAERFGPDVAVPHHTTLRQVWFDWFGAGRARQRYVRSAAATDPAAARVVVHRPGQVVALDTTVLPVQVRDGVFGDPVSVHLTLAMDVYTRSLVGFRLTLLSDTGMDVAMLLREVMTPTPMRPGWGPEIRWAYPGIPAEVVEQLAGYPVAGMPFFAPGTVTTDHGAVYKNHHLVEVQRVLGCNILPARVLRPTDKQTVERAFGAIRSLLLELLLGYTGVDVADRGADPQTDAVYTMDEMEHLLATWIVGLWQRRELGEHAPSWDPGGRHSPNTLFAASLAQHGFAVQVPDPELYYQLLPVHHVKIHGRRGVKIRGLWYDGPALDPHRGTLSSRGGRHRGTWAIHRDPRDCRHVYFADPAPTDQTDRAGQFAPGSMTWHRLRWTGLPSDGDVPAFSDARVQDMLREAARCGLKPRDDLELLPVLLQLIAARLPVPAWPTQLPKRLPKQQRTDRAREATRTSDAARDQPADPIPPIVAVSVQRRTAPSEGGSSGRRRAQPAEPLVVPPRLGDRYRRRSLFLLADDNAATEMPPAGGRAPRGQS